MEVFCIEVLATFANFSVVHLMEEVFEEVVQESIYHSSFSPVIGKDVSQSNFLDQLQGEVVFGIFMLQLESQLASFPTVLDLCPEDGSTCDSESANEPLDNLSALNEDSSELLVVLPSNLRLSFHCVDEGFGLLVEVNLEEVGFDVD